MTRTTTATRRRKPSPPPPPPVLIRVAFSPDDLARLLDHVADVDDEPVIHRLRMRLTKHLRTHGGAA
jgi:hypothetical protein